MKGVGTWYNVQKIPYHVITRGLGATFQGEPVKEFEKVNDKQGTPHIGYEEWLFISV